MLGNDVCSQRAGNERLAPACRDARAVFALPASACSLRQITFLDVVALSARRLIVINLRLAGLRGMKW